MKLSESIQPISYLKAHAFEIVRTVTENRYIFHVSPYRIIYQIINNSLYVHCILDERRDMQSLLMDRLLKYD